MEPHLKSTKTLDVLTKERTLLRVGVLMGGRGGEKEVSFNSGRTVCDHLDSFRYLVIPIFQRSNGALYILPYRFLHRGKTSDFEQRLDTEAEKISWDSLKERIDFMYIAMHGRYAEDGTMQGFLEILGIPYFGSKVMASALGMDKTLQKEILKNNGISVPKGISIKPEDILAFTQSPELLHKRITDAGLSFPYFVKPHKEGSSLGITVVFNDSELQPALIKAATVDPQRPQAVLLEEYVKGMEFTCIILTDYKTKKYLPLPPTEIVHERNTLYFDYEQKYMPGRSTKYTPARVPSEIIKKIQDICTHVTQILEIENISRIDGFVTPEGEIIIIDPNTFSGVAPSSFLFRQAAEVNMSTTALINHLIETELDHYGMLAAVELKEKKERHQMEQQQKKRVAVLLGGRSHEKEISLESGRNVFYKLSPYKYEPLALFVDDNLELYRIDQALLVRNSTKEIAMALKPEMKVLWNDLPSLVDFVFIGLHGGEGENGCVQGALEMLGLPYNGSSVLASSICMDKYKTSQYLKSKGFNVPLNYLIDVNDWQHDQKAQLSAIARVAPFPLIVKPHDDGCSVLVHKVNNESELIKAIESIVADGKKKVLVEEFVTGMELTVGVLGNNKAQALPPSQTVCSSDILTIEEKFLPGSGENQTPAPLPSAALAFVRKTIEDAYESINCKGYARIDCFYQSALQSPTGSERLVILEFNTLPGLTPATCIFHQAAEIGLKPMDFIDRIVELGFEEHTQSGSLATKEKVLSQRL